LEPARERRRAAVTWPEAARPSLFAFSLASLLLIAASMPACPQTFVPNWTLKFPATSPSAREQFAMAYDAMHGRVVLFGGFNGSSYLGDTWVWNGTTWALQTPAASPTARYGASMAYDAAHGKVVLFGGDGFREITWCALL